MNRTSKIASIALLALLAAGAAFAVFDPGAHAVLTAFLADPYTQTGMIVGQVAAVDLESIKAELKKIGDSVKEAGEKALFEAKKFGDMYAADKPKIDELLMKQGEIQARLQQAEQKLVLRGNAEVPRARSIGQQMVESPDFKAWIDGGGMRSAQSSFAHNIKAAITELGQPVTTTTTIGVGPDLQTGIIPGISRRMTVRDLITPGRTNSNAIQYVRESGFTNNAATVSETVQKPESNITYALVQSAVVTIAHWLKASKQILDDMPMLQSMVDGRLRYGLAFVEETQLLKGSGTGNNLNGIYTQATAYSAPIAVPAPSKIDILRLMILQASLAEYPSTGIVLHPSDWAAIELKKDTQGRYIIGDPKSTLTPTLWALPVVATQAMTVDTALVGAFKLGAQVFDREDANVVISSENVDDFIKNMVTIRAEERLGLAVYVPAAFIKNADLVGS